MESSADLTVETAFVLFGSTGDLATRKILPGLYALFQKGFLKEAMIVACGRRAWDTSEYRMFVQNTLQGIPEGDLNAFVERITYLQGELDDPALYDSLKKAIDNKLVTYHLAVHPEWFRPIIQGLGEAELKGRLMIEKPFGAHRDSALQLEAYIERYFPPSNIFRVDHYLVKQRLEDARVYKRENAKLVEVRCRILEEFDVHGRGRFYDSVGALKDVAQNHLLLMASTALARPVDFDVFPQEARARVIEQLVPTEDLLHGQYTSYQTAAGVAKDSQTETYARVVAESQHSHSQGVKVILETGKALVRKETSITFRYDDGLEQTFDLDTPEEQIDYATLIEAAYLDDRSTFVGMGEVLASWQFIDEVKEKLARVPLLIYPKGSDPREFQYKK